MNIIISRTDSIGDVVLTLPMAGVIKKYLPDARILFLGKTYTKDVIALSAYVDEFINYDELRSLGEKTQVDFLRSYKADSIVHVLPVKAIASLAKAAGIPTRVGTTHRIFHWHTCNKLVSLSRKRSSFHESQLNLKLLSFLDIPVDVPLASVKDYYGFSRMPVLQDVFKQLLDPQRKNIILHPKSQGSAKEWPEENYIRLAALLDPARYKIFVSGVARDGAAVPRLLEMKNVTDITGLMDLQQFIAFIHAADALVACSTGPLHIAAALGTRAIGLYLMRRPVFPQRWMPLGVDAHYLVNDVHCPRCLDGKDCNCMNEIPVEKIAALL